MPPEEPSPLRRPVTVAVVVALAVAVALLVPPWWAQVRAPPPYPVAAERVTQARDALVALAVVVPLDLTDYRREFFGEPWADVDGNGCDTRNDVLGAWLQDVRRDPLRPCLVVSGTLRDPYTGHLIEFERGARTSAAVQIDHVVALADAWRKGGAAWRADRALAFANDAANLVPVDGATNQDKGADDAASWLPPHAGFHCAYAVQQVLVKSVYGLGVTSEEFGVLADVLGACPRGSDAPRAVASVGGDSLTATQGRREVRGVDGVRRSRVPARRHRGVQRERPLRRRPVRVRDAAPARRAARARSPPRGRRPDA